ncbi:GNAT family N-acetyltransferase, partial [Rhizobium ruizarguesonis]
CVYAITTTENGAFIGCCSVESHADDQTVEIGYWLGAPYWNKGYTNEACPARVDMVFSNRQNVDQIDARCRVLHVASRR